MIKFENPNNKRFYYLDVSVDLIGHPILVILRGGQGRCIRQVVCARDQFKIAEIIDKITKRRLQRGYVRVE